VKYNKTTWSFWVKQWQEARSNFLNQAHTEEYEVRKNSGGSQYFYIDGYRIWVPDELCTTRSYRRWFLNNIIMSED
jgi:hypothetical protein